MKKKLGLFTVFIMVFCVIFIFHDEVKAARGSDDGVRVFDDAGLLTDEEEQKLQEKIDKAIEKEKTDIAILTTYFEPGANSLSSANDFYESKKFGYEKDLGTGVMFVIDMENRQFTVYTSGDAITYFTDQRIDTILDDVYSDVKDGDYYDSCKTFLKYVGRYMYLEPGAREPMTAMGIFIRLLISVGIGAIIVIPLVYQSGGKVSVNAADYFVNNSAHINREKDYFMRKAVTTRIIPKNDNHGGGGGGGSSIHTSSRGHSYGGGSRGF